MKSGIYFGLTLAKPIRISILSILLVLVGRTFNISGQTVTVLYSFSGKSDGLQLLAGLVQGNDGNFYGATSVGGTSTNCPFGCGTVFRITPSGTLTNLYSFSDTDGDARRPIVNRGLQGTKFLLDAQRITSAISRSDTSEG